jgi:short-chain fatty acids transporter
MIIVIPLILYLMAPKDESKVMPIRPELCEVKTEPPTPKAEWTIADSLENSMLLSMITALGGVIYLVYYFVTRGASLNLNIVNFTFLIVGIILHKRPIAYVRAVAEGVRGCAGIILQFPFYAGIMGMMKFSGLVVVIAGWFVAISSGTTYPVFTYISACIVNLFVPSGGGNGRFKARSWSRRPRLSIFPSRKPLWPWRTVISGPTSSSHSGPCPYWGSAVCGPGISWDTAWR